jgi:hypothetical protein
MTRRGLAQVAKGLRGSTLDGILVRGYTCGQVVEPPDQTTEQEATRRASAGPILRATQLEAQWRTLAAPAAHFRLFADRLR